MQAARSLSFMSATEIAWDTLFFVFSSRRRHTIFKCDWSSDVCSSDLAYVLQGIIKFVGVPALSIMVWATSLGLDIGGNFTPIGASANVVAYTTMEKRGQSIGWKKWLKLAIPATMISLIITNIGIYIKYITGFF